jgi:hypothetical protein
MARYYEENALIEFVKQHTPTINGETTMECVERAIRNAPTADVVPKSEVEKAKQGVAREIFEEIDGIIAYDNFPIAHQKLVSVFAELKNKYTESEGK